MANGRSASPSNGSVQQSSPHDDVGSRWLAGTRPKVQPPASPVSGIAQGGVARPGVALDARQTVIHPDKRQSHFPIGLSLGMELLGRVHESDRDVELVWQAFIGVPNRGATFRTEGAHDAPGFRECFWFWAEPIDLIWTIANPDRQWAPIARRQSSSWSKQIQKGSPLNSAVMAPQKQRPRSIRAGFLIVVRGLSSMVIFRPAWWRNAADGKQFLWTSESRRRATGGLLVNII